MNSKLKYYLRTIGQIIQIYCWLLVIAALYVAKAAKVTATTAVASVNWCIATYSGFIDFKIA